MKSMLDMPGEMLNIPAEVLDIPGERLDILRVICRTFRVNVWTFCWVMSVDVPSDGFAIPDVFFSFRVRFWTC